jgi:3-oxoadipate enol-lactonase
MSPTQSKFVQVNGVHLFTEWTPSALGADAPVVVLLHSGIGDSRMWFAQRETLASRYGVLTYDMRGFGQSSPAPGPFKHTTDLATLLDFYKFSQVTLVGSSRGGKIALDFALLYPARVTALVLIDSAPGGLAPEGDEPPQWEPMVAAFREGDFARAAELEVQIWVDGPFRTPDQVDPGVRKLVREMDEIALQFEASGFLAEQPLDFHAIERLEEIKQPTLVMVGLLDDPNWVSAARLMNARIPRAQLVEFANAAHFPNLELPDEVNRHLLAFLDHVYAESSF